MIRSLLAEWLAKHLLQVGYVAIAFGLLFMVATMLGAVVLVWNVWPDISRVSDYIDPDDRDDLIVIWLLPLLFGFGYALTLKGRLAVAAAKRLLKNKKRDQ